MESNALRIDETNGHRRLPARVKAKLASQEADEVTPEEVLGAPPAEVTDDVTEDATVGATPAAEAPVPDAIVFEAPDEAAAPTENLGELPSVLESLLFAAGAPVTLAKLVGALHGPSRAEVLGALEALGAGFARDGRGVRLVKVAGGYQLRTAAVHAPFVRRLLQERPPRLSRPMLETLAIVAYRQPCTRVEIEAIRGVDCDAVLTTLGERRLVQMIGRKEAPGRPLLYGTTKDFLEVFGLHDLSGMPTLRELGDGAADILAAPDLTVTDEGVVPTPAQAPGEDE